MIKFKNDKGITLLALAITIIVMMIITVTMIYSANNQAQIQKLDKMYSDIEQLTDKVSEYYIRNGILPLKAEYCTAEELKNILKENDKSGKIESQGLSVADLLDANDDIKNGEKTYYAIDLSKLDNLTLNYGADFNILSKMQDSTTIDTSTMQNLYIINVQSHRIYYPKGIMVDNKLYYTYKLNFNDELGETVVSTQIRDLLISKPVFEGADNENKYYVAGKGNIDIKANVHVELPNTNTLVNAYYAYADYNDESINNKRNLFVKCLLEDDEALEESNNGYRLIIPTTNVTVGHYSLWLRLEDQDGNEVITNNWQITNKNEFTIVEKNIEMSIPVIESYEVQGNQVEVTIKYDANYLRNIRYGEGKSYENAIQNYKLISESAPYTQEDGKRIYTLVVTGKDECVSVTAKDNYGNSTTSYVDIGYMDKDLAQITYSFSQEDGNVLEEDTTYDKAYVNIAVTNKTEINEIQNIQLFKGENELTVENLNKNEGTAKFLITENGTYQAKETATSEGQTLNYYTNIKVKNVITPVDFDRNQTEGKIDVVWLDTNNNVIQNPNAPVLKIEDENDVEWGLTAVEYDETEIDHWKEADTSKEWYKYIAQTHKIADDEEGTSRWANARANDGSLFVWIPRYAYKITYYDTEGNEIGYSTNEGIIDTTETIVHKTDRNYAQNEKVKTAGYEDYIVHPAFTTDADNGGGWDEELAGIWFGKFEAVERVINEDESTVRVVAGQSSWRSLVWNEMYNYGLTATYGGSNNSSNILQSHMIKNSEWGAVAYLSHSEYGLNRGKVITSQSIYYTGGDTDISKVYSDNVYQNSTHNEYGVYDLNGVGWEAVATYINNGHGNLTKNGAYNSELTYKLYENSPSTKFKTVYGSTVSDGSISNQNDYMLNSYRRGDAIFETSNIYYGATGAWYSSYSVLPYYESPFFSRGGWSGTNDNPGIFYFSRTTGNGNSAYGYRVALCY